MSESAGFGANIRRGIGKVSADWISACPRRKRKSQYTQENVVHCRMGLIYDHTMSDHLSANAPFL